MNLKICEGSMLLNSIQQAYDLQLPETEPGDSNRDISVSQSENQNTKQKQYCKKFNKDFIKMVHIKKKS